MTRPEGASGKFWKNYIGKIENLKTKRQTKKFDRSFLSIGSSRYVAQFLDHLEHSGYAIVSGEKKSAKIFRYESKFYNGNSYSKLPGAAGIGESIWWFSMSFHEFSLTKKFSWSLPIYIDAKFHGESISDGFRAIRERKVGQKLKNPEKKLFQSLSTYIDAKFHGESISDGFRAIRQRKVCQKSKKPKKSRQTRFSGHYPRNSLSINPVPDCRWSSYSRAL